MSTTARSAKESREAAARAAARAHRPRRRAGPGADPAREPGRARPARPARGVVLELLRRREAPNQLFEAVARAHGPVAHFRMAGEHVYLLWDPDLITDVFLTHARDVMKGRGLQATRPLLGNGLLTSEGEFHLRQRRLAQPGFHRQRIEAYAAQMVSEAERHSAAWSDGAAGRDGRRDDVADLRDRRAHAVRHRPHRRRARPSATRSRSCMAGFGQLSAHRQRAHRPRPAARAAGCSRRSTTSTPSCSA